MRLGLPALPRIKRFMQTHRYEAFLLKSPKMKSNTLNSLGTCTSGSVLNYLKESVAKWKLPNSMPFETFKQKPIRKIHTPTSWGCRQESKNGPFDENSQSNWQHKRVLSTFTLKASYFRVSESESMNLHAHPQIRVLPFAECPLPFDC